MRAARWHGPADVRIDDVPEPALRGSFEVVIAVEACGICGSDVEEYRSGPVGIPVGRPHPLTGASAPIVLGHEIVGRVAAAGLDAVVKPGARVSPSPVISCGRCRRCREGEDQTCAQLGVVGISENGGLADYVVVDSRRCSLVAEDTKLERAALIEPYSIALHALGKAGEIEGRRVAVVGGGAVGCCLVDVLRSRGIDDVVVIDPRPAARRRTAAFGVRSFSPESAEVEAQIVFEASGAEDGLRSAVAATGSGGRVVVVGFRPGDVPVAIETVVFREITIVGSVGHTPVEFQESARLINAGVVGTLLDPVRLTSLEDVPKLLASAASGGESRKIVVVL